MPTIAVILETTAITAAAAATAVAAVQIQITRDFAPRWGIGATVYLLTPGMLVTDSEWSIALLDHTDQAGDLGYHDTSDAGQPLGKVFIADTIADGASWSTCLSHELLEMLVDPLANQAVCARDGKWYARECADACEDSSYPINGVLVSDFVLPSYFTDGAGPFDFMHILPAGLPTLGAGGYASVFDPANPGAGWQQIFGERANRNARHPRAALRATPLALRQRSERSANVRRRSQRQSFTAAS